MILRRRDGFKRNVLSVLATSEAQNHAVVTSTAIQLPIRRCVSIHGINSRMISERAAWKRSVASLMTPSSPLRHLAVTETRQFSDTTVPECLISMSQ